MSRLRDKYYNEIRNKLKDEQGYENIMQVPGLKKIVISMGLAEALKDKNILQDHIKELAVLSGQKPVATKAKKAISNFKLREGAVIGLMVTLRGTKMFDFFDRLVNISSPRIPDFRGFARKGDGNGNANIGIKDQQIFPEIDLDQVKRTQGMNIAFVTSATTDAECFVLLESLGFPFKR